LLFAGWLSARASAVSVLRALRWLFPVAGSPRPIVALGVGGVTECFWPIGLCRPVALYVVATCRILLARFAGVVPAVRVALGGLPGVGRLSAIVVLVSAFGRPTLAVVPHLFRVAYRTGLAPGEDVRAVESALVLFPPKVFLLVALLWLILLGRFVCLARLPECWLCAFGPLCVFRPVTPPPDVCRAPAGVPPAARRRAAGRPMRAAPAVARRSAVLPQPPPR
jgi:Predicted EndoIII-related endonuclease